MSFCYVIFHTFCYAWWILLSSISVMVKYQKIYFWIAKVVFYMDFYFLVLNLVLLQNCFVIYAHLYTTLSKDEVSASYLFMNELLKCQWALRSHGAHLFANIFMCMAHSGGFPLVQPKASSTNQIVHHGDTTNQ
jgi:hypothetical protein